MLGITLINVLFYIAFCFIPQEEEADYVWVLQQYRNIYIKLDIPDPLVSITDRDITLIRAHHDIYR